MPKGKQKFLEDLCKMLEHEWEVMPYQDDMRCGRCGNIKFMDRYGVDNGIDYSGI